MLKHEVFNIFSKNVFQPQCHVFGRSARNLVRLQVRGPPTPDAVVCFSTPFIPPPPPPHYSYFSIFFKFSIIFQKIFFNINVKSKVIGFKFFFSPKFVFGHIILHITTSQVGEKSQFRPTTIKIVPTTPPLTTSACKREAS